MGAKNAVSTPVGTTRMALGSGPYSRWSVRRSVSETASTRSNCRTARRSNRSVTPPDLRLHVVREQHRRTREPAWQVRRGRQEVAHDQIESSSVEQLANP